MKMSLKKIITYICLFFIFLYPFNSTISELIYKPYILSKISIIVSVIVLYIMYFKPNKVIESKKILTVFLPMLLALLFIVINNHDITRGNSSKTILFLIYLLLIPLFKQNINLFKPSGIIIKLFGFEHIFMTYFATFFSGAYTRYVLPILDKLSPKYLPSRAFKNQGVNPGFTTHYSANAMYLSIIAIYFFTDFLTKKNKKSLFWFVISIGALFITGKRGHSLFVILTCLIEYIILKRKNLIKKAIILLIILCISIFTLQIAEIFIPSLGTVFNRFSQSSGASDDILSGRNLLYSLAIRSWKENIMLGKGWGSYSEEFQLNGFEKIYGLSYLDAHNIYLQLLSEVGIIGFIVFAYIFINGVNGAYIRCKTFDKRIEEKAIYYFSFGYQLFFLMYGITGNPLYDVPCFSIYFICIGLSLSNTTKEEM